MITTLIGGESYPVLARNNDEGVYNWYRLRVGEREGWASGRFLDLNVDLNTLPLEGSIFDQIDGAADIGARAYTRAVMHLRTRPSLRMPVITEVPWGADLEWVGRTVQAGIDQWLHVRYKRTDRLGRCQLGHDARRAVPSPHPLAVSAQANGAYVCCLNTCVCPVHFLSHNFVRNSPQIPRPSAKFPIR